MLRHITVAGVTNTQILLTNLGKYFVRFNINKRIGLSTIWRKYRLTIFIKKMFKFVFQSKSRKSSKYSALIRLFIVFLHR